MTSLTLLLTPLLTPLLDLIFSPGARVTAPAPKHIQHVVSQNGGAVKGHPTTDVLPVIEATTEAHASEHVVKLLFG